MRPAPSQFPLLLAFFLSGVSALGFELIWIRLLGLTLGAETFGLFAVLMGFFGGLALGAAIMHRAVRRARNPVRVYAACEAMIAVYGVVSPWLLLAVLDRLPALVGHVIGDNQSALALSVNVAVAGILLLPATLPMGVTTVALVEAWRRTNDAGEAHYGVGRLYAANTLGATIGIVVSTYWLVPVLGPTATVTVLAAACLAAGAIAVWWQRGLRPAAPDSAQLASASMAVEEPSPLPIYLLLGTTGLAAIAFEAVGTQVLSQILRNTVYTFANVLAVYLVGTSLGAWLYSTRVGRTWSADRHGTTLVLLFALTLSILAAMGVLGASPQILVWVVPPDSSYVSYIAGEVLVTSLVFLPPTILMGATFSHLLGQLAARGVGYGYAVNTLAGAAAPLLFGLLLVPHLGLGWTMSVTASVYGLTAIVLAISMRAPARRLIKGISIAGLVAIVTHSPLSLVQVPPGYELVARKQGMHGTVSVSERPFSIGVGSATRVRLLQVNQHFLMGGALGQIERRMGHLSMLIGRAPRAVLFLGVGTGITAGTALADRDVQRVDAVELVPEVLEFLDLFSDFNRNVAIEHRVRLHASDARRFVRATHDSYDLIVGELFHPSVNGAGGLFTREHFAAAGRRLNPGGVFVQWLPLYQLSARDLAMVVRTFVDVFPHAYSVLGTYNAEAVLGLVAARADAEGRTGIDMARVERLLARSAGPSETVHGSADLLAAYMTSAAGLTRFAGEGPVNTDLNQRLLFDAPLRLGAEIRAAHRSLEALWPFREVFPNELLLDRDPDTADRWRDSARARTLAVDRFVAAELMRAGGGDRLSQPVLLEYLAAYESDPQFPVAWRMLLELAGRHPQQAGEILREMSRRNPEDARLALTFDLVRAARGPDQIIEVLRGYLQGR